MTFRDYAHNKTAQLEIRLIRSALALANYRMQRDKQQQNRWLIWHSSTRKPIYGEICVLGYLGWGKAEIGQWWHLYGVVPQQVKRIVQACVATQAKTAIAGERSKP